MVNRTRIRLRLVLAIAGVFAAVERRLGGQHGRRRSMGFIDPEQACPADTFKGASIHIDSHDR